jgi:hypothetical protein
MNKGYAFGFLIVLLVLALGLYVAYTGFVSSREALRAEPTSPPRTGQATRLPVSSLPTAVATLPTVLTPTLEVTVTLAVATLTSVVEPPPTEPPAPAPTEPPAAAPTEASPAFPTDTPAPQTQPPTPAPIPAYQFRLAGPPMADSNYPSCCYIFGTVRDAAGNGLEGIQVQVGNEWNPPVVAVSKGGVDLGKYDIPIGRDVVSWDVLLLDAAGNQISTKVQVPFDPNVANAFRVDWQRTH